MITSSFVFFQGCFRSQKASNTNSFARLMLPDAVKIKPAWKSAPVYLSVYILIATLRAVLRLIVMVFIDQYLTTYIYACTCCVDLITFRSRSPFSVTDKKIYGDGNGRIVTIGFDYRWYCRMLFATLIWFEHFIKQKYIYIKGLGSRQCPCKPSP